MSDPKLAELIAMMNKRDKAERYVEELGRADGDYHRPEHETAVDDFAKANNRFIRALVNWFRETYTKERA